MQQPGLRHQDGSEDVLEQLLIRYRLGEPATAC
jgi:hypothetical protein